jgi:hypothetical protein
LALAYQERAFNETQAAEVAFDDKLDDYLDEHHANLSDFGE